jgi:hypothetical protein
MLLIAETTSQPVAGSTLEAIVEKSRTVLSDGFEASLRYNATFNLS